MEKIIFFCLAIPILAFIFYLGGSAIMKGFSAKVSNRPIEPEDNSQLGDEILKLNELFKSGALTQEEFDKAKKKILND
ncbi:SHOCT domain-containing protein [Candidatus Pelagibacter sp.]|jgi:hypothetical protein|nr:SHOCT domain-containing protein [Candidatus Pelagibacter sp.]